MKEGTFLVTEADEGSAVLRDVADGQIHTLDENPDVAAGDVLEATIEPQPPMEVVWQVVDLQSQRTIPVAESPEPPTRQTREIAADQPDGEVTRQERAGDGELHVITVPPADADDAVADVLDDAETVARAARLGVTRVEVRADRDAGIVSVRYLPD